MQKSIRIYGCGGTGTNLLNACVGKALVNGFADIEPCYVDTSMSNLRGRNIPAEQTFLFEGVDGSGKERAENNPIIAKSVKKILETYKPTDVNLFITSASGGSGSVISYHLAAEIINSGKDVIFIVIGSSGSHKEIDNTIKALRSFDAMSNKTNSPVVIHYLENSQENGRAIIDLAAINVVTYLRGLLSGTNRELDSADIRRWLNFPDIPRETVCLLPFQGISCQAVEGSEIISVVTLANEKMNTTLEPKPAYQAVGFVPEDWTDSERDLLEDGPVSFAICTNQVVGIMESLKERRDEIDKRMASRIQRDRFTDSDDIDL
jgi:hypothetical protein